MEKLVVSKLQGLSQKPNSPARATESQPFDGRAAAKWGFTIGAMYAAAETPSRDYTLVCSGPVHIVRS